MTAGIWFSTRCGYVLSVLRFTFRELRENAIPNDDSEQGHYRIF